MGLPLRLGPKGLLLPGRFHNPAGLAVDWSHPLAVGLQIFLVPDGMAGVVDLAKPRRSAATARALRRFGVTANQYSLAADVTGDLDFTGAFSVGGHVYVQNTTGGGTFCDIFSRYVDNNDSNNQGWEWWVSGSGSRFGFACYRNNANANSDLYCTSGLVVVGPMSYMHTADGTTRRVYVNGRADTTSTTLNQAPVSASVALAGDPRAGSLSNATELGVGCAWSRALTPQEVLLFHHDPFCMLRPALPEGTMFQPPGPADPGGRMFMMFPP